jgi:O-antigen/teichoic acid export membrane protein
MGGNKIVKNTGFLYFRMIIMLVISFFLTRVLLKALGVEGYGVYNVIGGTVAMFSSLRGAFSSSLQRFLNYEKGLGNHAALPRIYSMGVNIHLIICIIFLLIVEPFGIWYINYKLVIPNEMFVAAHWVFQFSVMASIVLIMTIPQDAVLIANQKMDIYVYITLVEAILKLAIVFLLPLVSVNSLILYAFLVLVVSFITRLITTFYCRRTFVECRYIRFWDNKQFKELGAFAGWNFLGNTAFSFANEGANIILNLFGGPIANAARGISYQLKGALTMFIGNIQIATSPHLTEVYAKKDFDHFFELFNSVSKISFFIMSLLGLPLIFYTEYFLKLWLHDLPQYTVSFTQLMLWFMLVRVFHGPIDTLFKAEGNIRPYQIIDSIVLILSLPTSYFMLKHGFPLTYIFISMIVFEMVDWACIIILANRTARLNLQNYLKHCITPSLIVLIINLTLFYEAVTHLIFQELWPNLLVIGAVTILSFFLIWIIGLNTKEKKFAKNLIYKKINRI